MSFAPTNEQEHPCSARSDDILSRIHYDVTNIDEAAAYIAGVYDFNNNSKVELIRKDDKHKLLLGGITELLGLIPVRYQSIMSSLY